MSDEFQSTRLEHTMASDLLSVLSSSFAAPAPLQVVPDPLGRAGCVGVIAGTARGDGAPTPVVAPRHAGNPLSIPLRITPGLQDLGFVADLQSQIPTWPQLSKLAHVADALGSLCSPAELAEGAHVDQGMFWSFADQSLPANQGHWARSVVIGGWLFWAEKRGMGGPVSLWKDAISLQRDIARVTVDGTRQPAYVHEPVLFSLPRHSLLLPRVHSCILFTGGAQRAAPGLASPGRYTSMSPVAGVPSTAKSSRQTRYEPPAPAPQISPAAKAGGVRVNHDTGLR